MLLFMQPWQEINLPGRLAEIAMAVAAVVFIRFGYRWYRSVSDLIGKMMLKRKINAQFESRLSSRMMERLRDSETLIPPVGEARNLAIMACHVRGIETMVDLNKSTPQRLLSMVNHLITTYRDVVVGNDGMMERYSGNRMIAIWNAPVSVEDPGRRAVEGAINMIDVLRASGPDTLGDHIISIGIGIDAGEMIVGNIGPIGSHEYGHLGDPARIADYLAERSRDYHVRILTSKKVATNIDDRIIKVEIDTISMNGNRVFPIYAVLGYGKNIGNQTQISTCYSQHSKFLSAYRDQRWDMAIVIGNSLRTAWNGNLKSYYDMMVARCKDLKANPPGRSWDGIYRGTVV
jgi:adenylate cyclase